MRLGSDPEVFLQDKNGSPVSVIGYINANKWAPMQIPGMAEGFTLQEDNVALEYGIPPSSSSDEFAANIKAVMLKSLEYLPDLSFSQLSCTIFPEEQMRSPDAYIFGCEPDFNAWNGETNQSPKPPHELMRSAGGHIHVETQLDPYHVARMMDLFLGVPSVLMDKGEERKQMYGKAGACRVKPYGVEYRVLSNFWIFDDRNIKWVWDNTARALDSNIDVTAIYDDIMQAINGNDKVVAKQLCDKYQLEVL